MATVGSANVHITADDRQARSKMSGFLGFVKGAGKTAATVLGGAALFSGILTGISSVVMAGPQYEASMSKVKAVTGATKADMQLLDAQAKQLGKTTKYSASEAAEAMGYLGMAGYSTQDIMKSMPGLLDLAAAGNLDLGRAADIASNILSGFNLKASETNRVSDVLALSAASANTSVEQMGFAMSYVAPVAQGAGISLEETAAAIGVLSNAGIQGERAGTALRGVIAKLQSPTGATKDALKELGLTVADVNPQTNSLSEILKKLKDAGIDSSQAMQLVGMESGPALLSMLNVGSEGLSEFTGKLENAEGAGAKMASTMSDNMSGKWKTFLSVMESVSLSLFTMAYPAIMAVLDAAISLATGLANFLEPNISKVSNVIGPMVTKLFEIVGAILQWKPLVPIVTGLAAAFVTLKVVNTVATGIGLLQAGIAIMMNPMGRALVLTQLWSKAQMVLNATLLANPIGLVIAILVGLGAALVVAYQRSETFRNIVNGAWQALKNGFAVVINWFTTTLPAWVESVVLWFTNLKTRVSTTIQAFAAAARQLFQAFFTGVMNILQPFITYFVNTWNNLKLLVLSIVALFLNLLTGNFEGMRISVLGIVTALKNQASNVFSLFKNTVVRVVTAIATGIRTGFNNAKSWAISTIVGLVTGAIQKFNELKSRAISAVTNTATGIRTGFNSAKTAAVNAVTGLYNGVVNWIQKVPGKITKMKNDMMSTLKSINLYSIGKDIIQGLVNGIGSMVGAVKNKVKDVTSELTGKVKSILKIASPSKVFKEFGKFTFEGFIIGADKMIGGIRKVAERASDAIQPDIEPISAKGLNLIPNKVASMTGLGKLKELLGGIGETHNHYWNVQAREIDEVQKVVRMVSNLRQDVRKGG